MGRPIQKRWFRDGVGKQILVNKAKWANGTDASADAFIESQTGTSKYRVRSHIDNKAENLKLSNMDTLAPGEMRIVATPFGSGSPLRVAKIQQHRVSVWVTENSATSAVKQYAWEDITDPAHGIDGVADTLGEATIGEADDNIIPLFGTTTISPSGGRILGGTVTVEGRGYAPNTEIRITAVPNTTPNPAAINVTGQEFTVTGTGSLVGNGSVVSQLQAMLAALPADKLGEAYTDSPVTLTVHNYDLLIDYMFHTHIVNGKLSTSGGDFVPQITGTNRPGPNTLLAITAISGASRPAAATLDGTVMSNAQGVVTVGTPIVSTSGSGTIAGAGYTVAPSFTTVSSAPAPAPIP